ATRSRRRAYPDDLQKKWSTSVRSGRYGLFKPFTDHECELLLDTLRELRPDLIGFSRCRVPLRQVAEVTRRGKARFAVPAIWGGGGRTLEPERRLEYAHKVCVGEGEEASVELAARIDACRDLAGVGNVLVKLRAFYALWKLRGRGLGLPSSATRRRRWTASSLARTSRRCGCSRTTSGFRGRRASSSTGAKWDRSSTTSTSRRTSSARSGRRASARSRAAVSGTRARHLRRDPRPEVTVARRLSRSAPESRSACTATARSDRRSRARS